MASGLSLGLERFRRAGRLRCCIEKRAHGGLSQKPTVSHQVQGRERFGFLHQGAPAHTRIFFFVFGTVLTIIFAMEEEP